MLFRSVVDVKSGIVPADIEVADKLRKSKKKVILVCNKLDNYKPELLYEFYELGLGEPFGICASQGMGVGDVLDEVVKNFGESTKPVLAKSNEEIDYSSDLKHSVYVYEVKIYIGYVNEVEVKVNAKTGKVVDVNISSV